MTTMKKEMQQDLGGMRVNESKWKETCYSKILIDKVVYDEYNHMLTT